MMNTDITGEGKIIQVNTIGYNFDMMVIDVPKRNFNRPKPDVTKSMCYNSDMMATGVGEEKFLFGKFKIIGQKLNEKIRINCSLVEKNKLGLNCGYKGKKY